MFAGGDVVTGAATVVEAVAAGRKAAYAIDRYIAVGKAQPEPVEFMSRKSLFGKASTDDLRSTEKIPHRHMPVLPPGERKGSFAEVELGRGPDDVSRESARCILCGCAAMFTCDLRRLATEYGAQASTFLGEAKDPSSTAWIAWLEARRRPALPIGVKRLKSQSPQALASAGRRPASHPLPKGVGRGEGLLFSELES